MKYLFLLIGLLVFLLIGCSPDEIEQINNSKVSINGTNYEVTIKEIPATSEPTTTINQTQSGTTVEYLPNAKYYFEDSSGIYLVNTFIKQDSIILNEYWTKINGVWTYKTDKPKIFALNTTISGIPQNQEFGYLQPAGVKYYVTMSDGRLYAASKLVESGINLISISSYYLKKGDRWFFFEKALELDKNNASVLQVNL